MCYINYNYKGGPEDGAHVPKLVVLDRKPIRWKQRCVEKNAINIIYRYPCRNVFWRNYLLR
jgi:hypothetical protein